MSGKSNNRLISPDFEVAINGILLCIFLDLISVYCYVPEILLYSLLLWIAKPYPYSMLFSSLLI
jgi:hypothetical protein